MKNPVLIALSLLAVLCVFSPQALAAEGDFTILHEFAGGAGDGAMATQQGSVISGSVLYGVTYMGGVSGGGVVFSMNTDGSGFSTLHEFGGGAGDGLYPWGNLILSGETLYGMTADGGEQDLGVIFSINIDGSGFDILHEFSGGADDGHTPFGALVLSGSTLYGATALGGDTDGGVVFSISTEGGGYNHLHEFAGGAGDGKNPRGRLILSDGTLYGTTDSGGESDNGVVFSINTDGSGFDVIHEFAGGAGDGAVPFGGLVISGSTLYGMTYSGGEPDNGVVFSVNADGSGYTNLHEFAGFPEDGENTYGSLALLGSTLYGATVAGGASDRGTLFSIGTDGTGYSVLHQFAGGAGDGHNPYFGSPLIHETFLYGMTPAGGDADSGVLYRYELGATPDDPTECFIGSLR